MSAILLVEDDENLRLALCDNLDEQGYRVTAVADGQSALDAAQREVFDLIILDIMLPDIDGYTLCERLRRDQVSSMILMLTARTLEDDLVRGLELGADDYLTKPYRLRELLARVRALLRRAASPAGFSNGTDGTDPARSESLACGLFRIDTRAREVLNPDGEVVHLTRTEFDLLGYLVKNHGRAMTRDELLDQVWGRDIAIDGRTVDNFISSLKKKLRWTSEPGFRIRTVRGVGYRMEVG